MPQIRTLSARRADARLELSAIVEHRARDGEDPAEFLPELPGIDEIVVRALVDEQLHSRGLAAEFALARLAAASHIEDAEEHRATVDRIELSVLRDIAELHPDLTRAVWSMIGRIGL
ncbi:hypothetical protein [Mycetocola reblochoni]|nr:hypothetical protein [Mycetocola reblochoni]RLP68618.1 hypothetical protein D9V30_10130 [Mycetocola reblochoni]